MAKIIENMGGIWQKTSLTQRVVLVGVLLACVGAAVLLVSYARKPDMALLYSGLEPAGAAKVVEKIRESSTPFELRDSGTTIMVPANQVHALRLTLASAGLPGGDHAGYKIMDDEKIGISPFSQKVNFTRAIEGEIAKSLQLMEGVQSARVHIAKAEEALFSPDKKETSATVMLKVKPGWRLTPGNIAAVVHLVAGSVEGLNPQKVVVVDAAGALMSNQTDNKLANSSGTFLDYKSRVEEYYSRKAEDMLAAALGPGRCSVRVDAVIDTTTTDTIEIKYDPEKILAKEENKGNTTSAPSASGMSKEENSTAEYLVGKKEARTTVVPGTVKTMTVAAFVDLSAPAPAGKDAAPAIKMTVKDVEDCIRSAIGLKATDPLKVVETPFYHAPPKADGAADEAAIASREFYLEIARRGSLGVLVIGALVALKIFRGKKKGGGPSVSLAGAAGMLEGSSMVAGALPGASEAEADPEILRSRITRALQENPDEVKRMFLSWVQSEKGAV